VKISCDVRGTFGWLTVIESKPSAADHHPNVTTQMTENPERASRGLLRNTMNVSLASSNES